MKTLVSVKLTTLATFVLLSGLAFSNLAQVKKPALEPQPAVQAQSTKISQAMLKEISQNKKFRDASAATAEYGETVDLQTGIVERDTQVTGNWLASFPVINAKTKRPGVFGKLIYQQNAGKEPEVYFDNGGQLPPANSNDNTSTARLCGPWSQWKEVDVKCVPRFVCIGNNQKGRVVIYQKERTCIGTQRITIADFRGCFC